MRVRAGRLRPLPVVVTIPVASQVRAAADMIRAGEAPPRPVVVASCDGAMYPVDGLDTLEAYRMAGRDQIECTVVEPGGVAGAVGMHLGLSRRLPVNPFCVIDAIEWMRTEGVPLAGVDRRYLRLAELDLAGDVRGVFDVWLGRLAGRLETIPPFWHILGPLAEMERSGQARALESVMAFVHATGTAPDASTLRGILRQFAPAGRGRTGHVAAIEAEDAVSPSPAAPAGGGVPPVEGAGRILCECGREWYVDGGSGAVRSVRESDSMVVLTGQDGGPVYPVPLEVAEHMDMGNSPVYHYIVPGHFPMVLVSGRRLDGPDLEGVRRAVRESLGRAELGGPAPT